MPVVQPDHGAFPEILARTGGGRLVPPGDVISLADTLYEMLTDKNARRKLAEAGRDAVRKSCDAVTAANATLQVYRKVTPAR